jgi:hypothetical protein
MPVQRLSKSLTSTARLIVAALLVALGISAVTSATSLAGTIVPPVAVDDAYSTVHDQVLNVPAATGVLANDTTSPGWNISIQSAPIGLLNLNSDGSFEYEPPVGFVGTDSFAYQYAFVAPAQVGGAGANPSATVTINVTNNPPVTGDDFYETAQDTPLIGAQTVLTGDSDPDGDPITITGLADDVDNGTLAFDTVTGEFDYTPNPGFVGVDTFVYMITDVLPQPQKQSVDPAGLSGVPGTVTITVTGVDTPTPEPTTEPGEPTATPAPPAPTATSAPAGGVTDLPDTGTGTSTDSRNLWTVLWFALVAACSTAILRSRLKQR